MSRIVANQNEKKDFIFEKTVCFCTHLCGHTLTHKNISQKTSSGIKQKLFQHLKSVTHLSPQYKNTLSFKGIF